MISPSAQRAVDTKVGKVEMRESTPQERRSEQTRVEILDTALKMIVETGLGGLSIRALADRIDYTPGALYTYFDTKEQLIDSVRERCFVQLNDYLSKHIAAAGTPGKMLLEAGMAYVTFASEHPNEYHLMFSLEPSRSTAGEQRAIAMRELVHILEAGVAAGSFKTRSDYSMEAIALHCWATVHGLASLQSTVLRDERQHVAGLARVILKKVVEGIMA
jgi:AcrR family transcriptional regulator